MLQQTSFDFHLFTLGRENGCLLPTIVILHQLNLNHVDFFIDISKVDVVSFTREYNFGAFVIKWH